jgi:hypothetical protein
MGTDFQRPVGEWARLYRGVARTQHYKLKRRVEFRRFALQISCIHNQTCDNEGHANRRPQPVSPPTGALIRGEPSRAATPGGSSQTPATRRLHQ